jgi:kynurenine formamidase
MKLIDLSQPLFPGCPNCPVHPAVQIETVSTHQTGDWHMETLAFASHTGSHLDAPLHKIAGGAAIDELPLETFTGPAFIADLRDIAAATPIDAQWLKTVLPGDLSDTIVLLATGWGEKRAKTDEWYYQSPFLSQDGAHWLVEQGVSGVGIDHYSIGGAQEPRNAQTHEVLLGNGIWIVEELRFPDAAFEVAQPAQFWALPINLQSHSGAPCRPVLVAP